MQFWPFPRTWWGDLVGVVASGLFVGLVGGLTAGLLTGLLDDIGSRQSLQTHLAHDVPRYLVLGAISGVVFCAVYTVLKLRRNQWQRTW